MNVFAHHRNWPSRRPVLEAGFARLKPDVVALQEVVTGDGYDQAREVLGPSYRVIHQHGRSGDGVGAVVASRWPMRLVHEAVLPANRDGGWIGSLAVVEVEAPDPLGSVLVVHHKPTWQSGAERAREVQAVATARAVEELAGPASRHVVLLGDLDATPDAASIRFLTGHQSLDDTSVHYQDAWTALHGDDHGHTFTPANPLRSDRWRPRPGRRIDYIMVRCGDHGSTLDIAGCELAFDEPIGGAWASDHFGLFADLLPGTTSTDDPA